MDLAVKVYIRVALMETLVLDMEEEVRAQQRFTTAQIERVETVLQALS